MSKGKRMTRTVRIYEDDARVIEVILAGRGKGVSFADVVSYAIRNTYEDIAKKADDIIDEIERNTPKDMDTSKKNTSDENKS